MDILGLNAKPEHFGILQVCLRGLIVFTVALVLVRIADRRFLAKMSAFDVILGFVLASMLARAINGSGALFPSLVGAFVLVLLHRLIAVLAYHSRTVGKLVKGKPDVLVDKGQKRSRALRAHHISDHDLLEELRLHGKIDSLEKVRTATIERNGKISVIIEPASEVAEPSRSARRV